MQDKNIDFFSTRLHPGSYFMGLISNTAARSGNPAFLRALGYERMDEVLGKNTQVDLIHHSRADGTLFPRGGMSSSPSITNW